MVLVQYVTYVIATGVIQSFRTSLAETRDSYVTAEIGVLDCTPDVSDATHYVLAGVLTPRPTIAASIDKTTILANGSDLATITGVPTGWTYLQSNGKTGTVSGATLTVEAIEAGEFWLSFSLWPYIPYEVTMYAINTIP